ncbi:hypothetical protein F2P81_017467 [Scophthalmus maximus]|uniref:Uncharacterized protein n=1 Tax=Scophthalmus maximus TaxID=52904 RepID=A0A6A4S6A0_SCOMX|nr:hypothetical protein F2P81_017467 [Scophthalmus maximus]
MLLGVLYLKFSTTALEFRQICRLFLQIGFVNVSSARSRKSRKGCSAPKWFKPAGFLQTVFHFQQRAYPPLDGIFRKRVVWAGDIMGQDASIIIRQVKFTYNGTYICQVKNPPDVHGTVGEIKLRVVTTASFSDLIRLVLAVAGGITGVVVLLIIFVSCRRCRKRRQRQQQQQLEAGNEAAPRKERKDPTACHPSRSFHLYMSETSIEIDSSDGMISEASTKDPSSSEDEGPSSDDDDGGDDDSD